MNNFFPLLYRGDFFIWHYYDESCFSPWLIRYEIRLAKVIENLPHFPQADGSVKLAAGWLIDQCHLKGFQIGGAAVHQQQALVLINKGNATGQDVVKLAHHIRQTVADKFGVYLQPEVRFMGANGEVNSEQAIS